MTVEVEALYVTLDSMSLVLALVLLMLRYTNILDFSMLRKGFD